MRLSVLDQSPIVEGGDAAMAIARTLDLARLADDLGYTRYWLAEHHASASFAGTAPEILIGAVAAATRRLRVGSGGIMLSHYSSLKVAETFRMLECLHPGRIDLGIGRAPGADAITTAALRAGPQSWGPEVFPEQVQLLQSFLAGRFAADHPFREVRAQPVGPGTPPVWLLGSGVHSAIYAGMAGARFAHAHFLNAETGGEAIAAYRERFRPGPEGHGPEAALSVFVIAAETEAEARRLAMSRNVWALDLRRGGGGPFPTPETAMARHAHEADRAILDEIARRGVVGAVEAVKARLDAMAAAHGVDELIIITIVHDHEARRRSYELLAEAYGLKTGS